MNEQTAVTRKDVLGLMAEKFHMDPNKFLDTVMKTVMPTGGKAATVEEVRAFMMVANEYGLNPFTKQIYAFPSQKGIVPMVPIDGWVALVTRQPKYDGVELMENEDKDGNIYSVTCSMFVKEQSRPVVVTEYFSECNDASKGPWKRWPRRMLRHKAYIQCARLAFGLSGLYDSDEAERIAEAVEGEIVASEIPEPEAAEATVGTAHEPEPHTEEAAHDPEDPPQEEAQPELPNGTMGQGKVEKIKVKNSPASAKKKWTNYSICISGKWYSTFSDTDGAEAMKAKDEDVWVEYTHEKDGEFDNLKSIKII